MFHIQVAKSHKLYIQEVPHIHTLLSIPTVASQVQTPHTQPTTVVS